MAINNREDQIRRDATQALREQQRIEDREARLLRQQEADIRSQERAQDQAQRRQDAWEKELAALNSGLLEEAKRSREIKERNEEKAQTQLQRAQDKFERDVSNFSSSYGIKPIDFDELEATVPRNPISVDDDPVDIVNEKLRDAGLNNRIVIHSPDETFEEGSPLSQLNKTGVVKDSEGKLHFLSTRLNSALRQENIDKTDGPADLFAKAVTAYNRDIERKEREAEKGRGLLEALGEDLNEISESGEGGEIVSSNKSLIPVSRDEIHDAIQSIRRNTTSYANRLGTLRSRRPIARQEANENSNNPQNYTSAQALASQVVKEGQEEYSNELKQAIINTDGSTVINNEESPNTVAESTSAYVTEISDEEINQLHSQGIRVSEILSRSAGYNTIVNGEGIEKEYIIDPATLKIQEPLFEDTLTPDERIRKKAIADSANASSSIRIQDAVRTILLAQGDVRAVTLSNYLRDTASPSEGELVNVAERLLSTAYQYARQNRSIPETVTLDSIKEQALQTTPENASPQEIEAAYEEASFRLLGQDERRLESFRQSALIRRFESNPYNQNALQATALQRLINQQIGSERLFSGYDGETASNAWLWEYDSKGDLVNAADSNLRIDSGTVAMLRAYNVDPVEIARDATLSVSQGSVNNWKNEPEVTLFTTDSNGLLVVNATSIDPSIFFSDELVSRSLNKLNGKISENRYEDIKNQLDTIKLTEASNVVQTLLDAELDEGWYAPTFFTSFYRDNSDQSLNELYARRNYYSTEEQTSIEKRKQEQDARILEGWNKYKSGYLNQAQIAIWYGLLKTSQNFANTLGLVGKFTGIINDSEYEQLARGSEALQQMNGTILQNTGEFTRIGAEVVNQVAQFAAAGAAARAGSVAGQLTARGAQASAQALRNPVLALATAGSGGTASTLGSAGVNRLARYSLLRGLSGSVANTVAKTASIGAQGVGTAGIMGARTGQAAALMQQVVPHDYNEVYLETLEKARSEGISNGMSEAEADLVAKDYANKKATSVSLIAGVSSAIINNAAGIYSRLGRSITRNNLATSQAFNQARERATLRDVIEGYRNLGIPITSKTVIRELGKASLGFVKDIGESALEEVVDELVEEIIVSTGLNGELSLDLTMSELGQLISDSALIGGILAGGINVSSRRRQEPTRQNLIRATELNAQSMSYRRQLEAIKKSPEATRDSLTNTITTLTNAIDRTETAALAIRMNERIDDASLETLTLSQNDADLVIQQFEKGLEESITPEVQQAAILNEALSQVPLTASLEQGANYPVEFNETEISARDKLPSALVTQLDNLYIQADQISEGAFAELVSGIQDIGGLSNPFIKRVIDLADLKNKGVIRNESGVATPDTEESANIDQTILSNETQRNTQSTLEEFVQSSLNESKSPLQTVTEVAPVSVEDFTTRINEALLSSNSVIEIFRSQGLNEQTLASTGIFNPQEIISITANPQAAAYVQTLQNAINLTNSLSPEIRENVLREIVNQAQVDSTISVEEGGGVNESDVREAISNVLDTFSSIIPEGNPLSRMIEQSVNPNALVQDVDITLNEKGQLAALLNSPEFEERLNELKETLNNGSTEARSTLAVIDYLGRLKDAVNSPTLSSETEADSRKEEIVNVLKIPEKRSNLNKADIAILQNAPALVEDLSGIATLNAEDITAFISSEKGQSILQLLEAGTTKSLSELLRERSIGSNSIESRLADLISNNTPAVYAILSNYNIDQVALTQAWSSEIQFETNRQILKTAATISNIIPSSLQAEVITALKNGQSDIIAQVFDQASSPFPSTLKELTQSELRSIMNDSYWRVYMLQGLDASQRKERIRSEMEIYRNNLTAVAGRIQTIGDMLNCFTQVTETSLDANGNEVENTRIEFNGDEAQYTSWREELSSKVPKLMSEYVQEFGGNNSQEQVEARQTNAWATTYLGTQQTATLEALENSPVFKPQVENLISNIYSQAENDAINWIKDNYIGYYPSANTINSFLKTIIPGRSIRSTIKNKLASIIEPNPIPDTRGERSGNSPHWSTINYNGRQFTIPLRSVWQRGTTDFSVDPATGNVINTPGVAQQATNIRLEEARSIFQGINMKNRARGSLTPPFSFTQTEAADLRQRGMLSNDAPLSLNNFQSLRQVIESRANSKENSLQLVDIKLLPPDDIVSLVSYLKENKQKAIDAKLRFEYRSLKKAITAEKKAPVFSGIEAFTNDSNTMANTLLYLWYRRDIIKDIPSTNERGAPNYPQVPSSLYENGRLIEGTVNPNYEVTWVRGVPYITGISIKNPISTEGRTVNVSLKNGEGIQTLLDVIAGERKTDATSQKITRGGKEASKTRWATIQRFNSKYGNIKNSIKNFYINPKAREVLENNLENAEAAGFPGFSTIFSEVLEKAKKEKNSRDLSIESVRNVLRGEEYMGYDKGMLKNTIKNVLNRNTFLQDRISVEDAYNIIRSEMDIIRETRIAEAIELFREHTQEELSQIFGGMYNAQGEPLTSKSSYLLDSKFITTTLLAQTGQDRYLSDLQQNNTDAKDNLVSRASQELEYTNITADQSPEEQTERLIALMEDKEKIIFKGGTSRSFLSITPQEILSDIGSDQRHSLKSLLSFKKALEAEGLDETYFSESQSVDPELANYAYAIAGGFNELSRLETSSLESGDYQLWRKDILDAWLNNSIQNRQLLEFVYRGMGVEEELSQLFLIQDTATKNNVIGQEKDAELIKLLADKIDDIPTIEQVGGDRLDWALRSLALNDGIRRNEIGQVIVSNQDQRALQLSNISDILGVQAPVQKISDIVRSYIKGDTEAGSNVVSRIAGDRRASKSLKQAANNIAYMLDSLGIDPDVHIISNRSLPPAFYAQGTIFINEGTTSVPNGGIANGILHEIAHAIDERLAELSPKYRSTVKALKTEIINRLPKFRDTIDSLITENPDYNQIILEEYNNLLYGLGIKGFDTRGKIVTDVTGNNSEFFSVMATSPLLTYCIQNDLTNSNIKNIRDLFDLSKNGNVLPGDLIKSVEEKRNPWYSPSSIYQKIRDAFKDLFTYARDRVLSRKKDPTVLSNLAAVSEGIYVPKALSNIRLTENVINENINPRIMYTGAFESEFNALISKSILPSALGTLFSDPQTVSKSSNILVRGLKYAGSKIRPLRRILKTDALDSFAYAEYRNAFEGLKNASKVAATRFNNALELFVNTNSSLIERVNRKVGSQSATANESSLARLARLALGNTDNPNSVNAVTDAANYLTEANALARARYNSGIATIEENRARSIQEINKNNSLPPSEKRARQEVIQKTYQTQVQSLVASLTEELRRNRDVSNALITSDAADRQAEYNREREIARQEIAKLPGGKKFLQEVDIFRKYFDDNIDAIASVTGRQDIEYKKGQWLKRIFSGKGRGSAAYVAQFDRFYANPNTQFNRIYEYAKQELRPMLESDLRLNFASFIRTVQDLNAYAETLPKGTIPEPAYRNIDQQVLSLIGDRVLRYRSEVNTDNFNTLLHQLEGMNWNAMESYYPDFKMQVLRAANVQNYLNFNVEDGSRVREFNELKARRKSEQVKDYAIQRVGTNDLTSAARILVEQGESALPNSPVSDFDVSTARTSIKSYEPELTSEQLKERTISTIAEVLEAKLYNEFTRDSTSVPLGKLIADVGVVNDDLLHKIIRDTLSDTSDPIESPFRPRKSLPKWERILYNELGDDSLRGLQLVALRSADTQASILAKEVLPRQLARVLVDSGLVSLEQNPDIGYNTQIHLKEDSPLNGLYTSPEFNETLIKGLGKGDPNVGNRQSNEVTKFISSASGMASMVPLVQKTGSMFRNLVGNIPLLLSTGVVLTTNPTKTVQNIISAVNPIMAWSTDKADAIPVLSKKYATKEARRQYYAQKRLEWTRLGILDSAIANEFIKNLQDYTIKGLQYVTEGEGQRSKVSGNFSSWANIPHTAKHLAKTFFSGDNPFVKGYTGIIKRASAFYMFPDVASKIFLYEGEKIHAERYIRMRDARDIENYLKQSNIPQSEKDSIRSRIEAAQEASFEDRVQARAAHRTRVALPTSGLTPFLIRWGGYLMGPYAMFPWHTMNSTFHNLGLAIEDIKEGIRLKDTKLQYDGLTRGLFSLTLPTMSRAISNFVVQATYKMLINAVTDEDENKLNELEIIDNQAIINLGKQIGFLPEYLEDKSAVVYFNRRLGTFNVQNTSYLDTYEWGGGLMNALFQVLTGGKVSEQGSHLWQLLNCSVITRSMLLSGLAGFSEEAPAFITPRGEYDENKFKSTDFYGFVEQLIGLRPSYPMSDYGGKVTTGLQAFFTLPYAQQFTASFPVLKDYFTGGEGHNLVGADDIGYTISSLLGLGVSRGKSLDEAAQNTISKAYSNFTNPDPSLRKAITRPEQYSPLNRDRFIENRLSNIDDLKGQALSDILGTLIIRQGILDPNVTKREFLQNALPILKEANVSQEGQIAVLSGKYYSMFTREQKEKLLEDLAKNLDNALRHSPESKHNAIKKAYRDNVKYIRAQDNTIKKAPSPGITLEDFRKNA